MKLIAPDYYSRFQCIADRCRHSCCIGWEIDIDPDTCEFYRTVGGPLGEELAEKIEYGDEPHFKLAEQERCPFLDERNLCRIITELGEEALCDICADHPRFRNHFSDRTEIGLGLCCEAAAELILCNPDVVRLTTLEDNGESSGNDSSDAFFAVRDEIFSLLQNRRISSADRIDTVAVRFDAAIPNRTPAAWARIYSALERLDAEWDICLEKLAEADSLPSVLSEIELEQLAVYFVYRHLSGSTFDGTFRERLSFCLLSVRIIDAVCAVCGKSSTEIARMYSSEIEYSDENIQALLESLG